VRYPDDVAAAPVKEDAVGIDPAIGDDGGGDNDDEDSDSSWGE
jgi:hypothetical protein